jgi:integrase
VRKNISGKTYTLNFAHKPTQAEILQGFAEIAGDEDVKKDTFYFYATEYIESRKNVLSPSSIRGYYSVLRNISDDFKNKYLSAITQNDIQKEINAYSVNHSPKSTRNLHGFISSVFGVFKPNMSISTTLPQKERKSAYIPTTEDVKRIMERAKGTDYEIPFYLGICGLRRSEICALTLDDLNGNILTINKTMVQDANLNWIVRPNTKNSASTRQIVIPSYVAELIRTKGEIYNHAPGTLLTTLCRWQDALGIEHFSFHKLRHFFATQLSENHISDADIIALGGWSTDYVMKSVYRHAEIQRKLDKQKKTMENLFDSVQ